MYRLQLILFSMIVPFAAIAQPGSFLFRNISINQGLSQSSVVDIAIDQTGFVWMATQDGLNRFDGHNFITFPLNFDDITTRTGNQLGRISVGKDHQLWLIARGGKLQKMNLFTQTITPFEKINNEQIPAVSCVLEDSGCFFVGTRNNGLWIYQSNGKRLVKLNHSTHPSIRSDEIKEIFKDQQGNYWVLTTHGLFCLNSSLQIIASYLDKTDLAVRTSSITQDASGDIWVGTFGQGLFIKEKNADNFKKFIQPGAASLPQDLVIETLHADQQGMIWAGTFGEGLYVIHPGKQLARHLQPDKKDPFSFAYTDVLRITQDNRGGIWIGTDGGGVSYYDKRLDNFQTYSQNNLPESISVEQVRAITTDRAGNIWCGTSANGLAILKSHPETISKYKKIGSLLTDKDGDIWIGTQENGLEVINASSKKKINTFLPGETIWAMLEDRSGNVWAATREQGLYLLHKRKGELLHLDEHTSPALQGNNIRTLAFGADSTLFIGFEKEGICQLDLKQFQLRRLPAAVTAAFNENVLIRSMYYNHPLLWVGSFGNGLFAVEPAAGKITRITDKQGLWNNTIYGILPDDNGSLWLSTNKGLCRLRVPPIPASIRRADMFFFTVEDGLQSNEFNTGAHFRSSTGQLYFGGINGLTTFNPSALAGIEQPATVIITQVQADDKPLITDTLITYKKVLRLPYQENSVSFSFAAFDVLSAGRLNYSYQLSGFDKDWLDAGTRNYAGYTHLPSGRYVFKVKATRSFSIDNVPVTSLIIIIEPPFWRKLWFIFLCLFMVAASLYGVYRYRISQLIRLQKVRNRIASDLHDEIGSALTHISILSELSKGSIDPKQQANAFLDRISEEVTYSGQALDDIVWSINSRNDTMEQTVARMRRYVAEVLETTVDTYSIEFDERFANRKLNMEQRRDFFLLFKELINNIYKHSRATRVEIRVWIARHAIHIRVADNGTGFDPSKATERNGVKNMQTRIAKWKGNLHIDSAPGRGTTIAASMPLA